MDGRSSVARRRCAHAIFECRTNRIAALLSAVLAAAVVAVYFFMLPMHKEHITTQSTIAGFFFFFLILLYSIVYYIVDQTPPRRAQEERKRTMIIVLANALELNEQLWTFSAAPPTPSQIEYVLRHFRIISPNTSHLHKYIPIPWYTLILDAHHNKRCLAFVFTLPPPTPHVAIIRGLLTEQLSLRGGCAHAPGLLHGVF